MKGVVLGLSQVGGIIRTLFESDCGEQEWMSKESAWIISLKCQYTCGITSNIVYNDGNKSVGG